MIQARFAVMHAALMGAVVALPLHADVMLVAMVASLIARAAITRMSEKSDIMTASWLRSWACQCGGCAMLSSCLYWKDKRRPNDVRLATFPIHSFAAAIALISLVGEDVWSQRNR